MFPLRQYLPVSNIYFLGFCLMAAGLPLSNFLMSVSQFVLAAAWLLEGNYKEKILRFLKSKAALALSSVYLMHLIGLIYTSDFGYAFHDLRIKLPLFTLTFILSTSPAMPSSDTGKVISIFLFAVFSGTVTGITELTGWNNELRKLFGYPERILIDHRGISLFISHIRFGLMICLSLFIIIDWMLFNPRPVRKPNKPVLIFLIAWFTAFLFILESLSGIIIFLVVSSGLITCLLYRHSRGVLKIVTVILFWAFIASALGFFSKNFLKPEKTNPIPSEPVRVTPSGNLYVHDTSARMFINGNPVWMYICWKELEQGWAKRSKFGFEGRDLKNQEVKYTLISFLTSKGLRKDSAGVASLSEEEIMAVEKGVTNAEALTTPGLKFRLSQIFSEFREYMTGGNPSGSSAMQRIEFWKAASAIILEHPLLGVGTGNGPGAYVDYYEKSTSKLDKKFRLRAHNQFLAIGVSFGITGMLWFIIAVFYPFLIKKKYTDFLFTAFFAISLLSMLNEDTLESQAGISFFVFFYCFFLFQHKRGEL